ncbi:hypothetical protein QWE_21477 [Agrobacterium albertimagni AOL15]|uniref:Uncharacterized protein n=1 Tax=Agrobacterium albertimagni AOL15 TaxID=1156935 RepID=K2Q999_9HYPH|nr:hypothetical protein QWE_21477 [Agrobacterium albertimagni AOL15]
MQHRHQNAALQAVLKGPATNCASFFRTACNVRSVIHALLCMMLDQGFLARPLSGDIDMGRKKQKLLAAYAEELSGKRLE